MTTTMPTVPIASERAAEAPAPTPSATRVPSHVRRRREARIARQRFYPATVFYTAYSVGMLAWGLSEGPVPRVLAFYAAGWAAWTLLEYFVHRWVLHGRFPDGPGAYRTFTHRFFDPLHWEHHERPWDGEHISGRLRDTLPFSAVFVGAAALAPLPTLPMLVAGLLQAYVVEEWVHHSVHYYDFDNSYFRYIRRHHLYHHSPRGEQVAYGLTNGFWDIVFGTRIDAGTRRALYRRVR